jgi:hypothetical protein
MQISIPKRKIQHIGKIIQSLNLEKVIVALSVLFSTIAIAIFLSQDTVIAYGDAESHLNIAKRVIHGLTPGFAQLGGIWLPIPHLLMVPFIWNDFLWRTGLAGAIVSAIAYTISGIMIYKITYMLFKNKLAAFVAFLVFALNLNILYMQSTPMTEVPLLAFFLLSTYYFMRYLMRGELLTDLTIAAFFAFCASLSRYDGWFLVMAEAGLLIVHHLIKRNSLRDIEGRLIIFGSVAFLGIALWLLWGYLILGNPLYFTDSPFSAKSQQQGWLAKGELPTYHDLPLSFAYFTLTTFSNLGIFVFIASIIGFIKYILTKKISNFLIAGLLLVPFVFNVITLFIGQSVIFIPHITPPDFDWTLFNVRYGTMMVPIAAIFAAFAFMNAKLPVRILLTVLFIAQFALYPIGYSKIISHADGVEGLSSAKDVDAQHWMAINYDHGLILLDDFARTMSVIRSRVPMQNVIYVGAKPYWEESFETPEKHARWIVLQKDDAVWKRIFEDPAKQGRLYKYFDKVYTSPEILIFRRNNVDTHLTKK